MDEIKEYITLGQTVLTLDTFRIWLESVANWLEATFPNNGYSAEWLSLNPGPPEGDRTGSSQLFKDQLEDAVNDRIRWLKKLERVTMPVLTSPAEPGLSDSSTILLDGLQLYQAETVMQADATYNNWIESVTVWLRANQVSADVLSKWAVLGKSPFRMSDGVLDTSDAWSSYWEIVGLRYRWLAEFISRSATIENQYRILAEIEPPAGLAKINFDGPGYELMAILKAALQKEGGHTMFRLFADDDSIYEYAALKFLIRGKEMTVKQLKKSVENQRYL